jgi:hypothetical protein
VLHFDSTQHIFHAPVLGICFCLSIIVLVRLCVFGTAMAIRKVFFVFLFMKVMSDLLEYVVLSVIMVRFQYSYYYYYYYYYYTIWMSLVTGLFFLVLLLNQQ